MLNLNGITVYPCLPGDDNGGRTAQIIFQNWRPDVFVTLYDIWMGAYNREENGELVGIHPFWLPIVMADHEPIPEATLLCARHAYRVISPTKYCYDQFAANGVDSEYIPLGVNNSVYKPVESAEQKKECRAMVNEQAVPFNMNNRTSIDEDSFLIMVAGANKDPYRKNFPGMFASIQLALNQCPEMASHLRVYVHSWMKQARDIPHCAKMLGVDGFCRGTGDFHNLCGTPDYVMAKYFGAADVFLHLSEGGGFEIPMLEALSCGLPIIGSDFIGMSEFVRGNGWPIPPRIKYMSPLDACQVKVDENIAADAIVDAYLHPEKRKEFGRLGREFSLHFSHDLMNERWFSLFERIRASREYTSLEARRL
jgi:glycosyltransferase involved in cell wall biosynthesis